MACAPSAFGHIFKFLIFLKLKIIWRYVYGNEQNSTIFMVVAFYKNVQTNAA